MKYRTDIDGLRSVAVIPVILFHMGFNWISGGYFGVDVFFVISGFLITSILYNKISENSFSMKDFWLRIVNRILPAQGIQYIKNESDVKKTNLILEQRFSKFSYVSFFDTYSNLVNMKDESKALIIKDADILYYDDDHLSYQGTTLLKRELNNVIVKMINKD